VTLIVRLLSGAWVSWQVSQEIRDGALAGRLLKPMHPFFAYAFVQRVAPSVIVNELMSEFDVGAAVLGNLAAFYFYAYVPLQMPVGMLMDRFRPTRWPSPM
jgi:hypothetical protein